MKNNDLSTANLRKVLPGLLTTKEKNDGQRKT